MRSQRPLFARRKHEEAFEEFDRLNPRVRDLFDRFTMEAISSGRPHYSADAIWQRLRWHVEIETKGRDDFKLNNNYRTYYGRRFMREHPEHDGFFETRERGIES